VVKNNTCRSTLAVVDCNNINNDCRGSAGVATNESGQAMATLTMQLARTNRELNMN